MKRKSISKDEKKNKSTIVVPSRIAANLDDLEDVEEAEITAEISLPPDGAWGWVVVAASFVVLFVIDGIVFSFGSMYPDITKDMKINDVLVALVNSVQIALYYMSSPIVSALINRFGFRACTMTGSIVVALSFLCTYFSNGYATMIIFYGVTTGFGCCLIGVSACLVVGFYFERRRAIAMSISGTGSNVGVMVMFLVNTQLVNLAGWRIVVLIHAGLVGILFFLAMTFRPLLALTVAKLTDDPTRTVTYLPSLMPADIEHLRASPSSAKRDQMATATERLFSAVSNAHFPTAASMLDEGVATRALSTQAGSSAPSGVSKLTLTARNPQNVVSRRKLQEVQSRSNVEGADRGFQVTIMGPEVKKKKRWWSRLCQWDKHVAESRPMYRDDAFYEGKIEKLPAYQKSVMDTAPEARTGIEYQMAVSRAVTTTDLEDRRGLFTTAIRRILATMMDPKLLKRWSFLILCLSGFLACLGLLIPYLFVTSRSISAGVDPKHAQFFVSVIGFTNAVGRILFGILASKFNALYLNILGSLLSAGSIMAFNVSYNVYFQYGCCAGFGLFISCVNCLRSLILVDLYGLQKLTNATGMLLLFQGFGCLLSTPLSNVIQKMFGYAVAFYVAGLYILLSALVLLPVNKISKKEDRLEEQRLQAQLNK